MTYTHPHLIVFGGSTSSGIMNDVWILNITKKPLNWEEVNCKGINPLPRTYHTAALCQTQPMSGAIIIFGGRSSHNEALNDCWILRKK